MTNRNPATILYDGYGTPVAVLEGDFVFSDQPGILYAGKDKSGLVRFISVTEQGSIKTSLSQEREQKQYDLTDPNFIYIGTADPGLATSSIGWSIARFTLDIDGNPTDKKTTEFGAAIWDDRITETYE